MDTLHEIDRLTAENARLRAENKRIMAIRKDLHDQDNRGRGYENTQLRSAIDEVIQERDELRAEIAKLKEASEDRVINVNVVATEGLYKTALGMREVRNRTLEWERDALKTEVDGLRSRNGRMIDRLQQAVDCLNMSGVWSAPDMCRKALDHMFDGLKGE